MSIIVFSFGRLNPVTFGHEHLINVVRKTADKLGAEARVYLSHTQDHKKNPLDYATKLKFAQAAFGNIVVNSNAKTIIEIMKEFERDGFTDVIFVGDQQRSIQLKELLNNYNGKEYNFRSIKTLSAGDRDPDAEGLEGISASKMRAFAINNDLESFTNGLPEKLKKAASTIMKAVQLGLQKPVKVKASKKKATEARKSPWEKMVAAVPKLRDNEKRSQTAIDAIKKLNKDYQDILDKEKLSEKEKDPHEIRPSNVQFPDGRIWISTHFDDSLNDNLLDAKLLARMVTRLVKEHGNEVAKMPASRLVIKNKLGIGIAIEKQKYKDEYRYILVTSHPSLKISKDQFVYMVESDDLNVQFHDFLNSKLFNDEKHMHPIVRRKLMKIAQDFKDFLGIELLGLKDVTVSGSNAAYTYTPKSDIDLHLVVDLPQADYDATFRELFDAKKYQYNAQHDYKIYGYDVELYVQNANEPHVSQGIYSVLNDNWVQQPKPVTGEYDKETTKAKYDQIKHLIILAAQTKDYDLASRLRQTIKKYRQVGLHTTGEFGPENLAFKALRANGYIKKLYDLLNDLKDKEFSLENHEQRLVEIDMSPGALKKFATSNIARSTSVGFEFEMIVPNMLDNSGMDGEFNYDDYDDYVSTGSIDSLQDDLQSFFRDTTTNLQVERAIEKANERILEIIEDQFQDYVRDNKDEIVAAYSDYTDLTDADEIEASYEAEDRDYDRVIEKLRDDFYANWDDLDGALGQLGLTYYSEWARKYNFDWPYYEESSSGEIDDDALREVAQEIKDAVGMPVKSAASYHAFKHAREEGVWYLETDSSIDADESSGEGGLELVSPPLPLEQAMIKLDQVIDWMNGHGAYTDSSTGFHMGVSIPEMENVDYIKLILFLGDKYVLDEFGRLGNTYTRSALSKMEIGNAPHVMRTMPGIFDALRGGLEKAALKMLAASLVPRNDKYTSVNIKDKYVEFRSAGGNYLEAIEKIKNTLLRYVRVMAIAADPNDAKQEYAKKLYKLLATAAANEKDLDVIKWFTMYSSGNLPKQDLIAKLKQTQARRAVLKGPETAWSILNMYDYPITIVKAKTPEEALKKGFEWEKANPVGGGVRGVRQATKDDIDFLKNNLGGEPQGQWQRWNVYDYEGRVALQVSARDRQEASRQALDWGRRNNRVIAGVAPDDTVDLPTEESKEIVTELANQPYPYENVTTKHDANRTKYVFTSENGINYKVSLIVELDDDYSEPTNKVSVEFAAFKNTKYTQDVLNTGDAFRVFATVASIVKNYLRSRPEITRLEFSADKDEPSRIKLYSAMAKMMPKFLNGWKLSGVENGYKYHHYKFIKLGEGTLSSLKEYIEESSKPFVWQKEEPKKEFTDMQLACILGGHEYTGELS